MDKNEMHDTLVVALGLALEEIHHPGSSARSVRRTLCPLTSGRN
jgi:hypothetical protein